MADLVALLRRAQRLLASLNDTDYAWMVATLRSLRPTALPPRSATAERQKRFRAAHRGVTSNVTDNGHGNSIRGVTSNVTPNVTHNVTERYEIPLEPPSLLSSSKTLAFESFWKIYPKRVGKGEALKAWKSKNCESKAEFIITAVEHQMAYLMREGGQYTPLPATWLNQKRWDDEPPQPSLLSEKTRGNVGNLQAFIEGVHRDAK